MSGKVRCGHEGCDRIRSAPCHVFGLIEYDHQFVDERPVGLSPIGQRTRRVQASDAGREYERLKRETRGEPCQIQSPECTGYVEHLHEAYTRGRAGGLAAALRDGPPPIPCCDACNAYVGKYPVWARERGLLLSVKDIHRDDQEIEI